MKKLFTCIVLLLAGLGANTVSAASSSPSAQSIQIEAESYSIMNGIQIEDTADIGMGKNIGYLDAGDWAAYTEVTLPCSGKYLVEYRVASQSAGGSLALEKSGGSPLFGELSFNATGGWQTWKTVSHTVTLPAGKITFGIAIKQGGWNLNWFRVTPQCNQMSSHSSSSVDNNSARWLIDANKSTFNFVSIKKSISGTETGENFTFSQLLGTVSNSGSAVLTIPLSSISSGVDIRNTRMQIMLFESNYLPNLHFTTQLDLASFESMVIGSTKKLTVNGNLILHGIQKAISFEVLVARTSAIEMSISPIKPILISSVDFDLNAGIEALRAVAGLASIGEKVPVYFNLFLTKNNPNKIGILNVAAPPSSPISLMGVISQATGDANLVWTDTSVNETGFLVRRKTANGPWITAGRAPANSTAYTDAALLPGVYDYKVIGYIDSSPSEATDPVLRLALNDSSSQSSAHSSTSSHADNSSDGSQTSSVSSFAGNATTGKTLFTSQAPGSCIGCHRDNDGDGRFTDGIIHFNVNVFTYATMPKYIPKNYTGNSVEDLSKFIEDNMLGNCTNDNCKHIAAYLWSLRGKDANSNVSCNSSDPVLYGPRAMKLLTSYEYGNSLQALFSKTLPANYASASLAFNDATIGNIPTHTYEPVTESRLLNYKKNAEEIAKWALDNNALTFSCSGTQPSVCADRFINLFAYKAFRRPLTSSEVTAFRTMVQNSPNGLLWAIQTVLMSPQFLYRSELGVPIANARQLPWGQGNTFVQANNVDANGFALDPFEFAAVLSYMYTGSSPDDVLLAAAAAGDLEDTNKLGQQIDRLLDSALGREHVGRFAGYWFRADDVINVVRPNNATFTATVKSSMAQEIKEIYKYIFYSNLSFTDMYKGEFTMLNSALSQYYGIPGGGVNNNDFRMVNTANSTRGGIIASGAFMTTNAHAGRTSPIKRAVHVRQDILCQNIPQPGIFSDPTGERERAAQRAHEGLVAGTLTTTDFYNIQTNVPGTICSDCHRAIINPLFAVDDFDNVGLPRAFTLDGKVLQKALDINAEETGLPIEIGMVNNGGALFGADKVGAINFGDINTEKDTGSPGLLFKGSKHLAQQMVANQLPGLSACLINKSFRFATGFPIRIDFQEETLEKPLSTQQASHFACVEKSLTDELNSSNGNPRGMLKALGMSSAMRFRR